MRLRALVLVSLLIPPLAAHAQSEAALKEYFEGRTVKLKLAMPGTEDGVDVYPGTAKPLDFPRHAARLKDYGTALRSGDQALVTKLKVKSKLIEFQLDGGGYGTSGDETSSSVNVASAPRTKREQNLEAELKREQDPVRRRAMKEELDDLKARRAREDARNRAAVAEAQETKKANIRQRRLEGGSRFNIRYKDGVPATAITPEAIKQALAAYVDFDEPAARTHRSHHRRCRWRDRSRSESRGPADFPPRACSRPTSTSCWARRRRPPTAWKAASRSRPASTRPPPGQVTAEFVEGVLIRFSMTSN